MNQAKLAAAARRPAPAESLEIVLWRVANPALAALIGWSLAGARGALDGLILGLMLILVPEAARRAPVWLAKLSRVAQARLCSLMGYLPPHLARRLQQRP